MFYAVWTTTKGLGGKLAGSLKRMHAQSRIVLDQELDGAGFDSWLVEFEAATDAEYKQKELAWHKRTSFDSYSGSKELPH